MNSSKFLSYLPCCLFLASGFLQIGCHKSENELAAKATEIQINGDSKGDIKIKPVKIGGELKREDPLDDKSQHPSNVHEFKMGHGQAVVIRLKSSDFDAYLIVRGSDNKELAFNDDDPDGQPTTNSKLVFKAPKKDTYKIVVTGDDNKVGKYELTIEAASEHQVLAWKATILNNLGFNLLLSGKPKEGAEKVAQALEIRTKLYPKDQYPKGHAEIADSLNNLGSLLLAQGEYAQAEPYFRDALAMSLALYPKNLHPAGHASSAISLILLGRCLQMQGEYAKAEACLGDALVILRALYPKEQYPQGHHQLAGCLGNLGSLLDAQGDHVKAESYLREALAMLQALYPQGHSDLIACLNNLGQVVQAQGEYAKAEPYYRDALARQQALYPKDRYPQGHPDMAAILNNLGFLLQAQGEFAKAESLYRDALAMFRAAFPKDRYANGHPQLALSLNNLGFLHWSQGEYAKAEPYFREGLAMRQALYPKNRNPQGHTELAQSLDNLGTLFNAQDDYAKAEPYIRDALAMRQALYPKDRYPLGHANLAFSLSNLGFLFDSQGEYAKAGPYYRDALAMLKALHPKDRYPLGHPHMAFSLKILAVFLQSQGAYAEAESYGRGALAMQQLLFDRLAQTAAEAEALNFAASLTYYLDTFLSIQRRLPEDAAAYDLVWKSRAPLTRTLQRRHLEMHASQDPVAQQLALDLRSARQRLTRALLSPSKDAALHKKKLDELTDAKEELEKHLARQLGLHIPPAGAQTSPQQLSQAIPEGAVFIDLVRYTEFSRDPKVPGKKGISWTPRFVAFLLVRGKSVVRIDLGEAAPLEKAWAAWREAIVNHRPERAAATALANLLWQPLRKHLPATTHTVWLAPDGQLAQVPWAALPGTQPNTIVLEDLALAVVPHGSYLLQHLLDKPAALDAKATLLTVGGVAYEKAPKGALPNMDLHPIPGDKLVFWNALPGTSGEQAQIVGLARKALKTEPLVLQGAEAGFAQVSTQLQKVRFAHLATHGFFADAKFRSAIQVDEKQFAHFGLERKTAGARSPLVLSGLVLAGANRPETPERGIMTAEAVVSLRLEDLELAVLSACETGLGETAGGEGVLGLQRAFHVAGARNVIASLWRVDDEATAALMALFYRKLWLEKLPPLQALRQAQLHIYRHPEEIKALAALRGVDFTAKELPKVTPSPAAKGARAHTSQWAAFVLSGTGK